jgi:hypothetical protein
MDDDLCLGLYSLLLLYEGNLPGIENEAKRKENRPVFGRIQKITQLLGQGSCIGEVRVHVQLCYCMFKTSVLVMTSGSVGMTGYQLSH